MHIAKLLCFKRTLLLENRSVSRKEILILKGKMSLLLIAARFFTKKTNLINRKL